MRKIIGFSVVSLLLAVSSACIPKSDNSPASSSQPSSAKMSRSSAGLASLGPRSDGYNIETVGDVTQPTPEVTVTFPLDRNLDIAGWAVDLQNKVAPGGVDLVIDGKHYPATYALSRPDVVQHFKNHNIPGSYETSGFTCSIPGTTLGKGPHVLTIHIITGDAKAYYETTSVKLQGQ